MSPLARSLLALACAALLHTSNAGISGRDEKDLNLPMVELKMGIVDPDYTTLRKIQVQPYIVPPTNSETDFLIKVPNKAGKNEALVGQDLVASDYTNTATRTILTPVKKGQHSPLKLHCIPKCTKGVKITADQYVINKLE